MKSIKSLTLVTLMLFAAPLMADSGAIDTIVVGSGDDINAKIALIDSHGDIVQIEDAGPFTATAGAIQPVYEFTLRATVPTTIEMGDIDWLWPWETCQIGDNTGAKITIKNVGTATFSSAIDTWYLGWNTADRTMTIENVDIVGDGVAVDTGYGIRLRAGGSTTNNVIIDNVHIDRNWLAAIGIEHGFGDTIATITNSVIGGWDGGWYGIRNVSAGAGESITCTGCVFYGFYGVWSEGGGSLNFDHCDFLSYGGIANYAGSANITVTNSIFPSQLAFQYDIGTGTCISTNNSYALVDPYAGSDFTAGVGDLTETDPLYAGLTLATAVWPVDASALTLPDDLVPGNSAVTSGDDAGGPMGMTGATPVSEWLMY